MDAVTDLERGSSERAAEEVTVIPATASSREDSVNVSSMTDSLSSVPREQTRLSDPNIVANEPAVDTECYYNSLIDFKKNLLSEFAPDAPSQRKLRGILLMLHLMNTIHAEAVLYKDYIRSCSSYKTKSGMCVRDWPELQQHLDRFSHADKEYHTLLDSFTTDSEKGLGYYDPRVLIDVGARLALIEECEESMEGDARTRAKFEPFVDRAKTEALEYLAKAVVPIDDRTLDWLQKSIVIKNQDDFWRERRERFISNTAFAVFGGLSLIVPMLIMTLHPTRLTTLLTSSLCIFAVAAILAGVMNTAEPKDIVGATAAYAAVLVVFVGTGGGSTAGGVLSGGVVGGIVVGSLAGAVLVLTGIVIFLGLFAPGGPFNEWWRKFRFPKEKS